MYYQDDYDVDEAEKISHDDVVKGLFAVLRHLNSILEAIASKKKKMYFKHILNKKNQMLAFDV